MSAPVSERAAYDLIAEIVLRALARPDPSDGVLVEASKPTQTSAEA
jgi:hypothetical protein